MGTFTLKTHQHVQGAETQKKQAVMRLGAVTTGGLAARGNNYDMQSSLRLIQPSHNQYNLSHNLS